MSSKIKSIIQRCFLISMTHILRLERIHLEMLNFLLHNPNRMKRFLEETFCRRPKLWEVLRCLLCKHLPYCFHHQRTTWKFNFILKSAKISFQFITKCFSVILMESFLYSLLHLLSSMYETFAWRRTSDVLSKPVSSITPVFPKPASIPNLSELGKFSSKCFLSMGRQILFTLSVIKASFWSRRSAMSLIFSP